MIVPTSPQGSLVTQHFTDQNTVKRVSTNATVRGQQQCNIDKEQDMHGSATEFWKTEINRNRAAEPSLRQTDLL